MKTRKLTALACAAMVAGCAVSANAASVLEMALKGAAIGFAVKTAAKPLDSFINTVTLQRNMPINLDTKVVPILSVGEKGYVGGAQVSGPKVLVDKVKAVFQYEKNFSANEYRIKVLVPSASLNPIKLDRVEKVGISALIDVSLSGGLKNQTVGESIRAGDVLKAGAVAVAVKNLGSQMNSLINTVSFNKGIATKVTPMASFGDKTYIGGAQVSASSSVINTINAVWQYEEIFKEGKFRIKALVPTTSSNPLKMKRVKGAGITAVIDASLKQQHKPETDRYTDKSRYYPWDTRSSDRNDDYRRSRDDDDDRKDNGKHKGWSIGKHKGWYKNGKIDSRKWEDRRDDLDKRDRLEFDKWFSNHKNDKDSDLERAWQDFQRKLSND